MEKYISKHEQLKKYINPKIQSFENKFEIKSNQHNKK